VRLVNSASGHPALDALFEKDPEMHAAILEARKNIEVFIKALQSPHTNQQCFSLKKPFRYEEDEYEEIWMTDISYDGVKFHGIIGNPPVRATYAHEGDEVAIYPIEVYDWLFLDGTKIVGAYTVELLRKRVELTRTRQVALTRDAD
jgi:uncharacterized protein YegJ (DUF2314 family)